MPIFKQFSYSKMVHVHYTSYFSDFSLPQLRKLLNDGPDAKHHNRLQGYRYLKMLRTARINQEHVDHIPLSLEHSWQNAEIR